MHELHYNFMLYTCYVVIIVIMLWCYIASYTNYVVCTSCIILLLVSYITNGNFTSCKLQVILCKLHYKKVVQVTVQVVIYWELCYRFYKIVSKFCYRLYKFVSKLKQVAKHLISLNQTNYITLHKPSLFSIIQTNYIISIHVLQLRLHK